MESTDPIRPSGSDSMVNILRSRLSPRAKLLRKLIAPAVSAYLASARMAYRLKRPWVGKLGHLDHITIPCHDAQIAEEFYVGLLGARREPWRTGRGADPAWYTRPGFVLLQ